MSPDERKGPPHPWLRSGPVIAKRVREFNGKGRGRLAGGNASMDSTSKANRTMDQRWCGVPIPDLAAHERSLAGMLNQTERVTLLR